ncbi:MAG: hemerythrin family protein [Magnetococcales bacterium]|nr:hemerythrin family protein [Magnetococcales bacterium]
MSMMNIEWSDEMSVGVASIDADHKKLVGLVNDLFSAFFIGVGDDAVTTVLTEVIDYTQHHFAREEDFLRTHGSATLAFHAEEHRKLTEQVLAISRQGASALSEDVLLFLRDWLTHHILGTDMVSFMPYRSE